ncbi:MAG: nucleotidyltransferase domain-containing protein [Phycisphaerales bacterium]|nr:MAG: nucleotidyltransferase domain-containing protein [Phycisphaerales bacterium]
MRSTPASEALFPAVRRAVLATLLLHPEREWYFRDLAKYLGLRPSSLTRELRNLVGGGILRRREDGNRVYYQAEPACPFLPELRGLMVKTAGLVEVLRQVLEPVTDRIVSAFVYGSIARGEELSDSDIDFMVIGETGRFELSKALREAEQRLARAVNTTVYKADEFAEKVTSDDHFVRAVLDRDKLFVLGCEDDLERARTTETRRQGTDDEV